MEDVLKQLVENLNNKDIKWPTKIGVKTVNDTIYMYINNPDLNMQDDNACFEAWIIALKQHLNIQKFILDWNNDYNIKKDGHYNRFIFRVYKFRKMFVDCFEIDESKMDEVKEFMQELKLGKYLLNEPLAEKEYKKNESKINEEYIEGLFFNEYEELLKKKTSSTEIYSQLPVGVFKEKVKKDSAVFTGGKSALDLWGINDKERTISIFELKYNNIMMGIVSELLFYMYVLEELCISKDGSFDFLHTKKSFRGAEKFKNNEKYSILNGYFLTDRLHPLITKGYINELNEGLKHLGELKIGNIYYKYEGNKIELL